MSVLFLDLIQVVAVVLEDLQKLVLWMYYFIFVVLRYVIIVFTTCSLWLIAGSLLALLIHHVQLIHLGLEFSLYCFKVLQSIRLLTKRGNIFEI
jgi:hypothetical protein